MRKQEQLRMIGMTTLGVIATAGIVMAAAVAPGALLALKPFVRTSRSFERHDINRAIKRLLRRGFVEEVERRGYVIGYRMTDRGREELMRQEFARAEIKQPRRWDGKWRLIVFDVPERRRHLRDMLRMHFQRLGLHPIQKSVWLTPFPCDDLVQLIKVDLGLGRSVQYFTVGKFSDREEEKGWRIHFDV